MLKRIDELTEDAERNKLTDPCENLAREEGGGASDASPVSLIRTTGRPGRKVGGRRQVAYVAFCAAEARGIPLEKVFRQVHGSNMSKLGPDGNLRVRPRGQFLGYTPRTASR